MAEVQALTARGRPGSVGSLPTWRGSSRALARGRGLDESGSLADLRVAPGPSGDRRRRRTVFELSGGTFKAHAIELVASGDDAVLGRFHVVAERDDLTLDQDGMQRFAVRDGKIVSLDNLFGDERAMDAFFA